VQADLDSGELTDKERIEAQAFVDAVTQPRPLVPDEIKADKDGRPHGLVVWRDQVDGTPMLYTPYVHGQLHGKVTVYKSSLSMFGQALTARNFVWKRPPLARVQDTETLASIAASAPLYVYMDVRCSSEAEFKAKGLEASK
jgi:hypothetical protein